MTAGVDHSPAGGGVAAVAPVTLTAADIAGIHQAIALFAHVFDNDDLDALPLVFTPGFTSAHHSSGTVVTGLDAGREYLSRRPSTTPDHQTVNTIVLVGPDGIVRARSRFLAVTDTGEVHNGDYLDILERADDGPGWRIAYRRILVRFPRPEEPVPLPPGVAELYQPTPANQPRIVG
ncbi:nuclear transport factor 2 family protein [Frankia sp. AgB1.9]|uniref:YybH family protein n=1 Tax=unclassified Frankia TaxID=2632575 RepID=UPI001932FACD|nr:MULTISPECIES: nuclear transport factor 2 family protein [unclassified Frankia]MBL7553521.1 nuclear transport factor 2 family protein [Frankia sp. AgB1.9]MBL7624854.1 nuclear transport factor 2 family protein [Frankia sp. AgB1.8]